MRIDLLYCMQLQWDGVHASSSLHVRLHRIAGLSSLCLYYCDDHTRVRMLSSIRYRVIMF